MASHKAAWILLVVLVFVLGINLGLFLSESHGMSPVGGSPAKEPLPAGTFSAEISVVAVSASENKGIVNKASVEIREGLPGEKRILFNTNPFVEPDTQESIEVAAKVAENFTGKSLRGKDVIYSITETKADLVGGPSAGAALAIATIGAIKEESPKEKVAITGTISENGRIGRISGVMEKAAALGEAGTRLFLVPEGQSTITYYKQEIREEKRGFLTIQRVNYVPKTLDLREFAEDQWGMQVKEVSTIREAVENFF